MQPFAIYLKCGENPCWPRCQHSTKKTPQPLNSRQHAAAPRCTPSSLCSASSSKSRSATCSAERCGFAAGWSMLTLIGGRGPSEPILVLVVVKLEFNHTSTVCPKNNSYPTGTIARPAVWPEHRRRDLPSAAAPEQPPSCRQGARRSRAVALGQGARRGDAVPRPSAPHSHFRWSVLPAGCGGGGGGRGGGG